MPDITKDQDAALKDVRFEFGLEHRTMDGEDVIATDRDGDRWRLKPDGEFWAITTTGERVNNRSRHPTRELT